MATLQDYIDVFERVLKAKDKFCIEENGFVIRMSYEFAEGLLSFLREQETLLNKAYELLADMDLDFFCEDLICDDGWCDEHCGKNGKFGTTPECVERWLRKQILEGGEAE